MQHFLDSSAARLSGHSDICEFPGPGAAKQITLSRHTGQEGYSILTDDKGARGLNTLSKYSDTQPRHAVSYGAIKKL